MGKYSDLISVLASNTPWSKMFICIVLVVSITEDTNQHVNSFYHDTALGAMIVWPRLLSWYR